jgi:hypothetical protein
VKQKLERLGLVTLGDLLLHAPFRNERPVTELRIAERGGDDEVAIRGEVLSVSKRRRGRLQMLTARVSDGSATIARAEEGFDADGRALGAPPPALALGGGAWPPARLAGGTHRAEVRRQDRPHNIAAALRSFADVLGEAERVD